MIYNKHDVHSIEMTSSLLKQGKILILPTDTVYGFSGIVGETDEKIRTIKGRSETKPFIQLIAKPSDVLKITDDFIPDSLLSKWPGALTIIVNDKTDKSIVGKTVALRCPGDEWLRAVIEMTESPIYSTSVNRSGSPVLSKIEEIKAEFEREVDAIVAGGDSTVSIPSTIVRIDGGEIVVVRKGAIVLE